MARSLPRRTVPHIGVAFHARTTTPAERFGGAALGTAAVGVGAVAAWSLSVPLACPFHAVTGVPCPGCGMTRLAGAVVHGDVLGAAAGDPVGLVLLLVVGSLALVGIAARAGFVLRLPSGRAVPATLLAVLLLRWALLVAGATSYA